MSWKLRTLVSLSCAVMAGQALAAELDTRVYIVPSVNYTVMDNDWQCSRTTSVLVWVSASPSPSI